MDVLGMILRAMDVLGMILTVMGIVLVSTMQKRRPSRVGSDERELSKRRQSVNNDFYALQSQTQTLAIYVCQ
jgi:hypothetical protein